MSEGEHSPGVNCCPACGAAVASDPTNWFGDAACRFCGERLFFIRVERDPTFFAPNPPGSQLRDRLVDAIAAKLNVDKTQVTPTLSLDDLGADSLALVEIMMQFEEEGGLNRF